MSKEQAEENYLKARRAHYKAANPSEATMRRETHYSDRNKRDVRVRALLVKLEAAQAALKAFA